MTAGASIREGQREASAAAAAFVDELRRRRRLREGWTEVCLDSERRFGHRAARLYPYVGRANAVRTPLGQGTLLQALEDRPGRPGAAVAHLGPRAYVAEFGKDGKPKKRAVAVFVSVESVKPYRKGAR